MREINWRKVGGVILIWSGVMAVATSVMVAGVIGFLGHSLPKQIPLFYSLPWGEEQLAAPWKMVWAVSAIWVIWILSWLTVKINKEPVLYTFVAGAGLLSETIIMLGLVRIIMIVS